MIPVVDVSKWQGSIDFARMRSRGVQGLILRATHGPAVDSKLQEYHDQARSVGHFPEADIGYYSFCNPKRSTGARAAVDFAEAVERVRGDLDTFLMLDVESYANEPGRLPPLYGQAYADWLHEMVDTLHAWAPAARVLFYTNAAYWDPNVGAQTFGAYDIIVARYPFYSPAAAATHPVPVDASEWAAWITNETPKRPIVPRGWDTWDGWQFSAGYNSAGPTYGASSSDLDLNIVKPEAWARWTASADAPPQTEHPPVIVVPPAHDTLTATATVAATGDNMLTIIGSVPEPVQGKRWVWNGLVKFDTTEPQVAALQARGAFGSGPGSRLDNPVWLSAEEIALIPTVKG